MPSLDLRDLEGLAAWWAAKKILTADQFAALLAYEKAKAFGLAKVWDMKLLEALYASLTTAIRNAQTLREWVDEANKILAGFGGKVYTGEAFSSWYADLVFRMNVIGAYNAGRYAEMFNAEWIEKAPFWMFVTAEDERVCEICAPLDGKVFRKDDEAARHLLPMLHFSCFVGETRVVGAFERGFRAPYSGPVVALETLDGRRLTLTVNHPVLTRRGWVAAEHLNQGDDVFGEPRGSESVDARRLLEAAALVPRAGRQPIASPGVDFDHRPTSAEERFRALGMASATRRTRVRMDSVDFDGDAVRFDGEVEIVGAEGELLQHGQTPEPKRPRERRFMESDPRLPLEVRPGREFLFRLASLAPLAGFPSGPALAFDFGAGSTGPFEEFGFMLAPNLSPGFADRKREHRTRNPRAIRKTLQTLAGRIGSAHLRRHALGPAGSKETLSGLERLAAGLAGMKTRKPEGPRLGAEGLDVALERLGGFATHLRRVEIREFRGDVFDFQTAHGAILTEGILVSNCRCSVIEFDAADIEAGGYPISRRGDVAVVPAEGFDVDPSADIPVPISPRRAA